jgi:hypothetical protein
MRLCPLALVVTFALLPAACGGGDPPLPSVTMTFQPASVQASFRGGGQDLNFPGATVVATLVNPPTSPVYLQITEPATVLSNPPLSYVLDNQDGTFTAALLFNRALGGGRYDGTLRIALCQDQGCRRAYPVVGGELPYALEVAAPIAISASVAGAPVVGGAPTLRSGTHVRVESSEPCWFSESQGGVGRSNIVVTETSWDGDLWYGISTPGGIGSFAVNVTSKALPQGSVKQWFNVTE